MRQFLLFLYLAIAGSLTENVIAQAPAKNIGIPVLMYHEIVDDTEAPTLLRVRHTDFVEQMTYLKRKGYQTLSLGELAAFMEGAFTITEPAVVITFDDAWANQLSILPILQQHNFQAAFFITAGLGVGAPHLEWRDIYGIAGSPNFTVQSHSITHPYGKEDNFVTWATGKPHGKTINDVVAELRLSKFILEKKLGDKITHFAWPAGIYNEQLKQLALSEGYTHLYTIEPGLVRAKQDKLQIPRLFVDGRCGNEAFADLLTSGEFKECANNLR